MALYSQVRIFEGYGHSSKTEEE